MAPRRAVGSNRTHYYVLYMSGISSAVLKTSFHGKVAYKHPLVCGFHSLKGSPHIQILIATDPIDTFGFISQNAVPREFQIM